ncbi:MAG: UvrB/UvrC motif-containing protein [Chlamydiota bacterium]|nr:UvrB/UvrC motif-containing protein [Chlamydiota bacterium]
MQCESCQKNPATVHYTEIVNNAMVKINLCEDCAKQKGIDLYSKFSMADLLSGLTDVQKPKLSIEDRECANCSMTFRQFRDIGRFGCETCYETFQDLLKPLFEAIHKSTCHVGKVPQKFVNREDSGQRIKRLEEKLEQAIAQEAFEEAAQIRDQIKTLKIKPVRKKNVKKGSL